MPRLIVLFLLIPLILAGHAKAAPNPKRVALIVGNSAYRHAPELPNPVNDAGDIGAALRAVGFEVVEGYDLDLDGFRRKIRDFASRSAGADAGLFFYAGHGLQINGQNYLLPIDADLKSEGDLDFEALPVSLVLSTLERNVETSLVFLDACRDNPFPAMRGVQGRTLNIGRGLALMAESAGMFISFATQPGNVAKDGLGRNSPYTRALKANLARQGVSISDLMIDVRNQVIRETNNSQVPWENSSLTAQFFFNAPDAQRPGGEALGHAALPDAQRVELDRRIMEQSFWTSIQNSTDANLFREYLRRFPDGFFKSIALARIRSLDTPPPAPRIEPKVVLDVPRPAPAPPAEEITETYRVAYDVSEGILNMRGGPGSGYGLIVSIPKSATGVRVGSCTAAQDNTSRFPWCKANWEGYSGWISSCCVFGVRSGRRPR